MTIDEALEARQCNTCGSEFVPTAAQRAHHHFRCKACDSEYQRAYRKRHPRAKRTPAQQDHRRGAAQARRDLDPEKDRERHKAYYRRNRDLVQAKAKELGLTPSKKAHAAIRNALRRGELIKPNSCQVCGATCKLNAHHPDYDKPLEVEWLCTRCHGRKHRKAMGDKDDGTIRNHDRAA